MKHITEQIELIERNKNALGYPIAHMRELACMVIESGLFTPRPIEEYHKDMGPVLWWCWEEMVPASESRWAGEPPYVGTPSDLGQEVLITSEVRVHDVRGEIEPDKTTAAEQTHQRRVHVGGWPGYHTHFTPIPIPQVPK